MSKINIIGQKTTTTGAIGVAATISLDGAALSGHNTFADGGAINGASYSVGIREGAARQVGRATYTSGSPGTLTIDSILASTNSGSAITLSGNAEVYIDALAEDLLNPNVKEVTETVYSLTGTDVDPANGTVQTLALSANTTLTESLATGQAVRLLITGGDTHTVTWPAGIEWVDGAAPTLTAKDIVTLEKIGSDLIGYAGTGIA